MSNLTLFEIAQEYRAVAEVLMDSECDEQTLADTLEGERWPLELKAQNYGFVIRNLDATADAIEEAMHRMAERAASQRKRASDLRERLKAAMELAGTPKLPTPYFDITIKKNPPSVEIFDERQIPAQFMVTPAPPPPPVPRPDKKAIAAAFKAGTDVPGAKPVQGTRIEIK